MGFPYEDEAEQHDQEEAKAVARRGWEAWNRDGLPRRPCIWEPNLQAFVAATHKLHEETGLAPTTSTAPRCRRQTSFPKHNRSHEAASMGCRHL